MYIYSAAWVKSQNILHSTMHRGWRRPPASRCSAESPFAYAYELRLNLWNRSQAVYIYEYTWFAYELHIACAALLVRRLMLGLLKTGYAKAAKVWMGDDDTLLTGHVPLQDYISEWMQEIARNIYV